MSTIGLSTQFAQECPDQVDNCPQERKVCCEPIHERRLCLHSGKVICVSCQKCKGKKFKQCCKKVKKSKKCCC